MKAQDIPEAIQWHEGMLLTPEHFQQMNARLEMLGGYGMSCSSYRNEVFTASPDYPVLSPPVSSRLGSLCSLIARHLREKALYLSDRARSRENANEPKPENCARMWQIPGSHQMNRASGRHEIALPEQCPHRPSPIRSCGNSNGASWA